MGKAVAFAILSAALANAQTQAQAAKAMLDRLTEEAGAFRRIAPSLLGQETLEQKARKAGPRFHPRVGKDAQTRPPQLWQDRQIVSEYGFVAFPGDQVTLHELRRVISVDSHPAGDPKKAEESLARIISLNDEQREHELLKDFEKYGLVGAVTDFGPLLLLFTPRQIQHFEFALKGTQSLGANRALIFRYSQIDGAELLTIFESTSKKPHKLRVQGEIWVRADNYLPLRITLSVGEGQGVTAVREEGSVDYAASSFGTLVPSAVDHKELLGGQLNVQNSFIYSDFHRFGTDSEIHFTPPHLDLRNDPPGLSPRFRLGPPIRQGTVFSQAF
jgi:hypothetical protein